MRVHEPFQMLALLDDDLKDAMGLDVTGVFARNTMFGFPAERWKPWQFNGIEVLVPGDFNICLLYTSKSGRHIDAPDFSRIQSMQQFRESHGR